MIFVEELQVYRLTQVIQMPTARYPHVCYQMIYRLHNNGRHTWATNIALLLTKFGFQHVWAQQGVANKDVFFLSVLFTNKKPILNQIGQTVSRTLAS